MEDNISLKCPHAGCRKDPFSKKSNLDRHIKFMHKSNYPCPNQTCSDIFLTRQELLMHEKKKHKVKCEKCHPTAPAHFKTLQQLKKHIALVHDKKKRINVHFCHVCRTSFKSKTEYQFHKIKEHKSGGGPDDFILHNTAMNGDHSDYRKAINTDYAPECLFSDQYYPQIVKFLESQHATLKEFKFNFVLTVIYESPITKVDDDNEESIKSHESYRKIPVASSWSAVGLFESVEPVVNDTLHELLDKMTCHLQQGSGLVFRAIVHLDINISKLKSHPCESAQNISQACDSSPSTQITQSKFGHNYEYDLSLFYKKKFRDRTNTILDIKNSENWCFIFTIAAALYQDKFETLSEKEDANNYKQLIADNFKIDGIRFPTPFEDVRKFVKQNEHLKINLNIYTVQEDQLVLVLPNIAHENYGEKNINLLALFPKLDDGEPEKEMKLTDAHFVLINKIEDLFNVKDSKGKYKKPRVMCHLCLTKFTSYESEKFQKHKKFCTNVRAQFQDMPTRNYKLKFNKDDYDKQYMNEFVIFYDFECILRNTEKINTCEKCLSICKCPEETKSFTELQQNHVPVLFNYHVIDNTQKIIRTKTRYCPKGDAAEKMLKDLFRHEKKFVEQMTGDAKMIYLSPDQKRTILKKQNSRCRHCMKKCSFEKDDLVVDHSHYSGEIHGISHNLW